MSLWLPTKCLSCHRVAPLIGPSAPIVTQVLKCPSGWFNRPSGQLKCAFVLLKWPFGWSAQMPHWMVQVAPKHLSFCQNAPLIIQVSLLWAQMSFWSFLSCCYSKNAPVVGLNVPLVSPNAPLVTQVPSLSLNALVVGLSAPMVTQLHFLSLKCLSGWSNCPSGLPKWHFGHPSTSLVPKMPLWLIQVSLWSA